MTSWCCVHKRGKRKEWLRHDFVKSLYLSIFGQIHSHPIHNITMSICLKLGCPNNPCFFFITLTIHKNYLSPKKKHPKWSVLSTSCSRTKPNPPILVAFSSYNRITFGWQKEWLGQRASGSCRRAQAALPGAFVLEKPRRNGSDLSVPWAVSSINGKGSIQQHYEIYGNPGISHAFSSNGRVFCTKRWWFNSQTSGL